jgi:hypothetical protein
LNILEAVKYAVGEAKKELQEHINEDDDKLLKLNLKIQDEKK